MTQDRNTAGGDARIIAEVTRQRFGGSLQMFEHHGWPERRSEKMRKVQTRVKAYGSVKEFERQHSRERGT